MSDPTSTPVPNPGPVGLNSAAVLITRRDRVEFVNPAAARLLAAPADRLVGRVPHELFADGTHREVVERVDRLPPDHAVTGPVIGRLVRADGTCPLVEVTATALAADSDPGILWFLRDLAEHEAASRAVGLTDELFHQVFRHAAGGFAQLAADGRCVRVNPAFATLLGREEEALIGTDLASLTHPDDWPAESDRFRRVASGQLDSYEQKKRFSRPTGVVWAWQCLSAVRDATGRVRELVCQVAGLSEGVRAADNLRLLEAVVENARDAVLVTEAEPIDEPGPRIQYANPAFLRQTGYTADEVLGRSPRFLQGPGTCRQMLDAIRRSLEQWRPCRAEVLNYTKDGKPFWAELDITPLADATGWYTHWIAIQRDVTERKQSEQALRESHERLTKVLEVETVGVMFWDLTTGRLTDANDTFLTMTGYSRRDVEAGELTWQKLTPPEYVAVSEAEIRKFRATGRVGPYEKEYFCKDGTRRWFVFAGSSLGGNTCVEFCVDVADRKKAEQSLRSSEGRLRLALAAGRLGVWEWVFENDTVYWSPEAFAIFGMRPADFGRTLDDFARLVHPEDRDGLWGKIATVRSEGGTYAYEFRVVRPDGQVRWLANRGELIRDASGRAARLLGVVADVTERMQAEGELRESQARLRLAQHAGRIGIFDLDVATGRSVWTEVQEAIYGLPPDGFEGTHEAWARRVHPADREQVEAKLARCYAERCEDCEFEFRIVRADGAERWVTSRGMISYGPDGRPVRVIGTTVDITDRKQFEELLRDREHRLQAVLDTAVDAIITIDDRGTVESVNPATERMFGYSAAELVGRNVSTLMPPPYAAEHDGYLARYHRTGEKRIIGIGREVSGRRKDGSVFPIELAVAEIDNLRRYTGFIRDITDRKHMEARFLRAQRLESLGSLASGVAHDLNNVLTPVLMAVKLLLKDKPGGTRQAVLETALASIERGTNIVRQLLAFGGGVPGERTSVAVAEVVREVVSLMEYTLPKSITLAVDVPADLWPVTGDVTQLSQLLVNLCVNARDAMPAGGRIHIAAENFPVDPAYAARYPGAKPGRYVLLSVADTGSGIPRGVQERMFDPFFTTKPFGQGTGLGLATVQGIVKAHGGFVAVYSEVGLGAKFLVHLPAADSAVPSAEEPDRAAALPGHERLVLVVDDEPAVRLLTRATLEAAGYRVTEAGDAEAALAAYRAGGVAAVVLDMMMPGLDTPTAIRRLRQSDPSARVLAVSGLHPTGPAAEVLKANGIPFLSKPFTDETLLAALDRLLTPSHT